MTKTFRKLLAPLMFIGVVLATQFVHVPTASAATYPIPSPGNQALVAVYLSGATVSLNQYTVTATRLSDNKVFNSTFMPNGISGDSHPLFLTEDLQPGSGCTSADSPTIRNNSTYTFNVTQGGNSVAPGTTFTYCNRGAVRGVVTGPVTIAVKGAGSASASVSGKLTYTDSTTGQTKDMDGSLANITLLPSGCTDQSKCGITVPMDKNGNFSKNNLAPGNYNLNVYYNPCPGSVCPTINFTKAITLKAGANNLGTIGAVNNPSAPASSESDVVDCGAEDFKWFICPALKLLIGSVNLVDGFMMDQLNIDATQIFDKTTDTKSASYGYYAAWSQFRIIATALLVIGGLIMVASTALGLEILDAYTIRKTLPRILIAIILVSLSWPLMRFVVILFDTIGFDLRAIIYHPFVGMNKDCHVGVGTGVLSSMAVGVGLLAYGPAALTFLLTVFLAILVAFLALILRQAAIILLIILAPIWIICMILPWTQKASKFGWENFFGLMLVFPAFSGLVAIAHVFAAINICANQGSGFKAILAQAMSIAVYAVAVFSIVFIMRAFAGVVGNLTGMINDRNKGMFDRLSKYRSGKLNENAHKMKTGQRFSNRNALTRRFNDTTAALGTGLRGHFGTGVRGQAALDQVRRNAAMNDVMKSAGWAAVQFNDDALMAMTYNSAAQARAAGINENAIAAAQASVGFGRAQAIAAAQQLSTNGTGYADQHQLAQTIARASAGDEGTIASLAGFINSDTKRAGRHDLAPGFAVLNDLARQEAGYASVNGSNYGGAAESAWNSGSLYQHANDKDRNLQNAVTHYQGLLAGDQNARERAGVFFNELRAMQPNATGSNRNIIQTALDSNREAIDALTNPANLLNAPTIPPNQRRLLPDSAPGIADRPSGRTTEQYNDPTMQDAAGNVVGGLRTRVVTGPDRAESARERMDRQARTYERPDPNNL